MDTQRLHEIIDEYSTEKYFIEYGGYLSNHLPHGLIAFHRLGASEARIRDFINWYIPRLETSDGHSDEREIPITARNASGNTKSDVSENIHGTSANEGSSNLSGKFSNEEMMSLVGKRCSYYAILDWYEKQLKEVYSGSVNAIIQKRFPALVEGFAGSALHGLIHLGYGYAANSPRLVCEGLAYLHHSYLPFKSAESSTKHFLQSLGNGSLDLTEILSEISNNTELQKFVAEKLNDESLKTLETSDFQRSMRALFSDKADVILDCIRRVKFPSHIDLSLSDDQQKQNLFKWLQDCAATTYALCERYNDFFLIHGVTAAFALRNTMTPFEVSDPVDKVTILTSAVAYLYTLLAAYITQGARKLIPFEEGEVGRLESSSWEEIVTECLAEERDEHIYKLVQVSWELERETSDAGLKKIYKRAASRAMEYPLVF